METEPDKIQGFTLPKLARLCSMRDFRRVYRHGRRVHGDQLVVVGLENRQGHHRIGLAVSKDHGRAVRRNKIKRLVREAFRLTRPNMPGHFDLIVIPRPDHEARYVLPALQTELMELVVELQARRDEKPRRRRSGGRPGKRSSRGKRSRRSDGERS
ncbi:MAG: ribonuclease P protein component [Planctomycetota bacterium]